MKPNLIYSNYNYDLYCQLQSSICKINSDSFIKLDELDIGMVMLWGKDPSAIKPIGPRLGNEGVNEERQGLLSAQLGQEGSLILRMTLLAAGFIAGPQGRSVREICYVTGARIKSWQYNDSYQLQDKKEKVDVRIFLIDGAPSAILQALQIIMAAVDRYKVLIQGEQKEDTVIPEQMVEGVQFVYKPPPRRAMPNAVRTFYAPQETDPITLRVDQHLKKLQPHTSKASPIPRQDLNVTQSYPIQSLHPYVFPVQSPRYQANISTVLPVHSIGYTPIYTSTVIPPYPFHVGYDPYCLHPPTTKLSPCYVAEHTCYAEQAMRSCAAHPMMVQYPNNLLGQGICDNVNGLHYQIM